jgi:1,4-alpha-glucan branching enzyme
MMLTPFEVERLVTARHHSPHELLGMHPFRSGVVVRALLQDARGVEARPVPGASGPVIPLACIHPDGLFEGSTEAATLPYAYELVVTQHDGRTRTLRDPYSFLPTLSGSDLYLFGKGDERRLYDKLGAQIRVVDGVPGVAFSVWAPSARRVSVVGDFNRWDGRFHAMRTLGSSGVWELFIPGLGQGALYKFELVDADNRLRVKTDPMGLFFQVAPENAAVVWDTNHFQWTDHAWMAARPSRQVLREPMSTYELHIGSWRKRSGNESFTYRDLAPLLVAHLKDTGFTHVEFLPVAEHAFYPSWGYQVTGFFAPTSRFGTPDDFAYLVDALHNAGIGVIVDWVPAHFPKDDWALARFDGTALYEHSDPRKGEHQDWGTLIFNYDRHEVRNFLTANALFWCQRYHIDGLRVDAVASMLYLDYSRTEGQWLPNKYGGRENLEAVDFLRHVNHLVHTECPGVVTIAEESTAWPSVTRPPYLGGLGFSLKWNMGWMNDTLQYFSREPIHRKYHQNDLTFAMLYQYTENFLLPLSHDEVVHGKGSLRRRMPGDDWQAFANLRTLLAYQWLFPGKKLLFMGGEFGQSDEWNVNSELSWGLLEAGPYHAGVLQLMRDLNRLYRAEPSLWEADHEPGGFQWLDCSDCEGSVLTFIRRRADGSQPIVVALHLTPVLREGYRIGFPHGGWWREALNSDAALYGGSNAGNSGGVHTEPHSWNGQPYSAAVTLPPLGVVVFIAH